MLHYVADEDAGNCDAAQRPTTSAEDAPSQSAAVGVDKRNNEFHGITHHLERGFHRELSFYRIENAYFACRSEPAGTFRLRLIRFRQQVRFEEHAVLRSRNG